MTDGEKGMAIKENNDDLGFFFENEPDLTSRHRAIVSRRALEMHLRAQRRRTPEERAAAAGHRNYPTEHSHYFKSDKNVRAHSSHLHSSSDKSDHSSHPKSSDKKSSGTSRSHSSSEKTSRASHSHGTSGYSTDSSRSHGGSERKSSLSHSSDTAAITPRSVTEKSTEKKGDSRRDGGNIGSAVTDEGTFEVYNMNNEINEEIAAVKPAKKKRKGLKALAIILAILLFLTAVPVCAFFIMRARGQKGFEPAVIEVEEVADEVEDVVFYDEGKTLTYKGKKYEYNENVVPIAFFGLDKFSIDDERNMAGVESSQNDLNMVAVFDTATGEIAIIVVPRDSVVDVNVYDDAGDYIGIQPMQLCLAYPNAMGAGEQVCCENALLSVERILCGIEINNFVSLDVNSVGEMADAMGGVDLVSIQTIGDFTEGVEYHLTGNLARKYVQTRDTSVFNSDSMRRQRQIQFIKELSKKVYANILSDFGSVADLYGILNEHTYSTINLDKVTFLASSVIQNNSNFSLDNIIVLEGEPALVNGFMEFYPDMQSVFETVLSVFYKEAE